MHSGPLSVKANWVKYRSQPRGTVGGGGYSYGGLNHGADL